MKSEALWQAVLQPGPLMSDQVSFAPEDAQLIALLRALRAAGIADQELHLLCRMDHDGNRSDVLMHLRVVRCHLLERMHEQQRMMNELDNYVESIRKDGRSHHS